MKLTIEHLESLVVAEQYHVFPDTTMTVCCITLKNGFAVIGESACIDPKNFDDRVGREIARAKAIDKLWELEGYRIKQA